MLSLGLLPALRLCTEKRSDSQWRESRERPMALSRPTAD